VECSIYTTLVVIMLHTNC